MNVCEWSTKYVAMYRLRRAVWMCEWVGECGVKCSVKSPLSGQLDTLSSSIIIARQLCFKCVWLVVYTLKLLQLLIKMYFSWGEINLITNKSFFLLCFWFRIWHWIIGTKMKLSMPCNCNVAHVADKWAVLVYCFSSLVDHSKCFYITSHFHLFTHTLITSAMFATSCYRQL